MVDFRNEFCASGLHNQEQLAERGDPEALYALGLHYATGKSGSVDYVTAHKWFNLAAMRGFRQAMANRAELAREMSPAQVSDAQRAAREWLQTRNRMAAGFRFCENVPS